MNHHVPYNEDIEDLAGRLKGCRRVLLWGDMGTGKSILALALGRVLSREQGGCQLLGLDPGTPHFGVPGALCRGWWRGDSLRWGHCQALCTLDAARFRLPLVLAARRLLNDAMEAEGQAPIVIDPPGVVRGVGGAELLEALINTLGVDGMVILCRDETSPAPAQELAGPSVRVLHMPAGPAAKRPSRGERAARRTRLWDSHLADSRQDTFSLERMPVLGTPPPRDLPQAWAGRQAALLDAAGRTLEMGEVIRLAGPNLILRLPGGRAGAPAGILVRDAGRSSGGQIETMGRYPAKAAPRGEPAEMTSPAMARNSGNSPVYSRVGPAWATLVGGVFGDPMVHVRLRNQKQSFFFDLGDQSRLAARVAHQVDAVFLSHAHLDHIGGFVWFLRSRIGPFGPCKIFGPAQTITRIGNFLGAITWDRIEDNAPVFEVGEIDGDELKRARLQPGSPSISLPPLPIRDKVILEDDHLSIEAVICDHKIPSVGYALCFHREISVRKERLAACGWNPGPWLGRLKQCIAAETLEEEILLPDGTRQRAGELAGRLTIIRPGKKLVYAADMADSPGNREKIISLAHSAHTLFCETAFTAADREKARATQHLTTLAAVEIARQAGVERLVPFHFSKRYEDDPGAVYREILDAAGPLKIIGQFNERPIL